MKHFEIRFDADWKVLGGTQKSQAAVMVVAQGKTVGGADNKHEGSDQWMVVLGGEGEAVVEDKTIELKKNVLLLIEAGESHEIKNTGAQPLLTLNFYAPKEY